MAKNTITILCHDMTIIVHRTELERNTLWLYGEDNNLIGSIHLLYATLNFVSMCDGSPLLKVKSLVNKRCK